MIKKQITFLLYLLISILQFSGIVLAFVLEDLSSKKMGVARYLIFKKQEFETTLFTIFSNEYIYLRFCCRSSRLFSFIDYEREK